MKPKLATQAVIKTGRSLRRIEVANTMDRLRPEMLATAEIPIGGTGPVLRVSQDAVQQVNSQDVVFIRDWLFDQENNLLKVRPDRLSRPVPHAVVLILRCGFSDLTRRSKPGWLENSNLKVWNDARA